MVPTVSGVSSSKNSAVLSNLLKLSGGVAIVDGGLATELERYGADLNDPLWSAKCLIESPELIRQVHLDYLEAGANIIISASYQATIQGFEARGLSRGQSERLLQGSVALAHEARDIYLEQCKGNPGFEYRGNGKQHCILVAASIGSYGAYLADGSEYSGAYGETVTFQMLKDFHRRRIEVLAESKPDLLAFETIPNKLEAQAFAEILEESNIDIPAWFSFTSNDGVNVANGGSLLECAEVADGCEKVVAVGINCTSPRFIYGLIQSIQKVTKKPIIVYPNSGEKYDADIKTWVEATRVSEEDFASFASKWWDAGASLIGGCCRTNPDTIRAIHNVLSLQSTGPEC